MSNFVSPWWLLAELVVVALAAAYVAWSLFGRQRFAVRFSNVELLDKVAPSRAGWRRHVVSGVFLLALAVMVVAVARPQTEVTVPTEKATLMLAIDTSLSMEATDVDPNRLKAAQDAAVNFIDNLPEKFNVGLVEFAGSAQTLVPPTTDHTRVQRSINKLELREGTAIGDAVDVSLKTIADFTADAELSGDSAPAAIIVLSDGETTVGRPTADAIPLAKEAGVPVWTISFGTPDGVITMPGEFGGEQAIPVPVAPEPLEQLAKDTGGQAYTAESANQLNDVYKELGSAIGDETELSEIGWRWTLAGFALLVVAGGLSTWWFRRMI
ncbi:MAG: VWA domain-containing protein [Candidatus Microthrix subdominans]|nr:VWA domain-containing protein [Candidatus Microthrix sp.]